MQAVVAASNGVGVDLGFDPALRLTLPVADALEPLKYLRIFLQQAAYSIRNA